MNQSTKQTGAPQNETPLTQTDRFRTRVIGWHRFIFLAWFLIVVPAWAQVSMAPSGSPVLLTNAQQIVALGTNIAEGAYTARLVCVVHYVSPTVRRLYAQDGDIGLQATHRHSVLDFQVGQLVEIQGEVRGGLPEVRLVNATSRVLGEAPLPDPILISPHRLVRAEEPFRHVTVRGVIRDMVSGQNGWTLLVVHDAYPFEVAFYPADLPLPRTWLDAEIEVSGFAFPFINSNGRSTGFRFHVPGTNHVHVLSPGIADRFDGRPLMTIAAAAQLPESFVTRVRVAGTVTVHRPNGAIFLDDGTGVMHVDLLRHLSVPAGGDHLAHEPQTWLQPGERVEVIGARHNWYSLTPTLISSEFRRIGHSPPIAPLPVSLPQLRAGRHSGRLISIEGRVLDLRQWATADLRNYLTLVLRIGNDIIQARWESEKPAEWNLKTDTYVRITGVNDAEGSRSGERSTFQILLRTPEDVVPAPEPPFWTRPEVQNIGLAAGIVGLLSAAWILFQRWQMRRLERRVTDRTSELSEANEALRRQDAQRRAAEESLRASENRKAAVLETALDSIITIDQDGCIMDYNPAAEKTFGYTRDEVLGCEMAELIIPLQLRDQHRAGLRRAVETGADSMLGRRIEVSALRRNGEEFPVELALARISTESGPIFTAHIQDISERKLAEAERERALAHEKELSELKSRFVSMVSHEFRTPLGIIMSSAEILDAYLDRLPLEERRANLHDITQASKHMASLMEEVLLLSRVEAGKMVFRPATLSLDALCARLVDEVTSATSDRCPISFTAPPDLPDAQSDEALLRHIFTNLLSNAVKYSPAGSPVEFHLERRDHLAVFTVRDSGIGIPESDARQIFQAFHRGRNVGDTPGTGLGMVIVKRCVELHHGRIAFESRENQGTRFLVFLPLFGQPPQKDGGTTQFFRNLTNIENLTLLS